MFRRDLFRSLIATPLTRWLRNAVPRLFPEVYSQEADAAAIYRIGSGQAAL
jgi:hypothetical protein